MSKHDLIAVAGVTAGAVPSGFRLVPIEPTGVMKDCGAGSLPLAAAKPWAAGDCYRAMLAAAPLPAPATSVNEAGTAARTTENLVARLIKACRGDALTWADRKTIGEAIELLQAVFVAPGGCANAGFLQDDDYHLLHRFIDTVEDDDSYDIGKESVRRLADLGVVQSHGFGRYSATMFGYWVHERFWHQNPSLPLLTNTDRDRAKRAALAAKGDA